MTARGKAVEVIEAFICVDHDDTAFDVVEALEAAGLAIVEAAELAALREVAALTRRDVNTGAFRDLYAALARLAEREPAKS